MSIFLSKTERRFLNNDEISSEENLEVFKCLSKSFSTQNFNISTNVYVTIID